MKTYEKQRNMMRKANSITDLISGGAAFNVEPWLFYGASSMKNCFIWKYCFNSLAVKEPTKYKPLPGAYGRWNGEIFIVPHLVWHVTSVFVISSLPNDRPICGFVWQADKWGPIITGTLTGRASVVRSPNPKGCRIAEPDLQISTVITRFRLTPKWCG